MRIGELIVRVFRVASLRDIRDILNSHDRDIVVELSNLAYCSNWKLPRSRLPHNSKQGVLLF